MKKRVSRPEQQSRGQKTLAKRWQEKYLIELERRRHKRLSTRQKRLDELWDAFVKPHADPELYAEDRIKAALAILKKIRKECDANAAPHERILIHGKAQAIWEMIAAETGGWIIDILPFDLSEEDKDKRGAILEVITEALSGFPTLHAVDALDPVPVLFPRSLLASLGNALAALEHGEVHDLTTPSKVGLHGEPWSWNKMKLRAVQHVFFLKGCGYSKKDAQIKVSKAMRTVSWETLRRWEADLQKDNMQIAMLFSKSHRAGELSRSLRHQPGTDGDTVDGDVLQIMTEFEADKLADFGEQYSKMFGARHRQPDERRKTDRSAGRPKA